MLVLALMPSWSLCLSLVSGAVTGWVPDASAKPWFVETGSEDVSGNSDFGLSLPVSFRSGRVTGLACSPCRAALMLMRLCGFVPVPMCGFCPAAAACFSMPISLNVLTLLWFRNLWGLGCSRLVNGLRCGAHFMRSVKSFTRVARVSSSLSLQHGVSSFAHSSRCSGAIAAILVVAFVMLAAFACVYSATACGLPGPVDAATFAALLVVSFVFVPLWIAVLEFVGVVNLDGW